MEIEFIYLQPGNWFELKNIKQEKLMPYEIDSLQQEVLDQVTNRSSKLDFINIHFGSVYTKKIIENITFHLDKKKFTTINSMLASESKPARHPIITFHGTTSLNVVNSILDQGYIIPGLDKNNHIKAKHGAAYGIGVYTSPHLDKCLYYTQADNTGYVYVLINLTFLGKMKLIISGIKDENTNVTKIVNGAYPDGFNTRIVSGLEQLISADPNRVIPIAVMKIKIA